MQCLRVLALPSLLKPVDLVGRVAVVFDVLRATTTMAAALAAGASEIRVFGTRRVARAARAALTPAHPGRPLLAGEKDTRKPDDFDIGNTPSDFTADRCSSRTILMATTNGTKALVAARSAEVLLTGALVNVAATAARVRRTGLPVTLVCSGTQDELALEDLVGCGALIAALGEVKLENDTANLARMAWQSTCHDLPAAFLQTFSAANLRRAGLLADVASCAVVDSLSVVCRVTESLDGLVVRRWDD